MKAVLAHTLTGDSLTQSFLFGVQSHLSSVVRQKTDNIETVRKAE